MDPSVWSKKWGVHIQAASTGVNAVKYLGAYVAKTAISDHRIVSMDETHVTFLWKDRSEGGKQKQIRIEGVEFVRRYLRHVLPSKMHSIRHYGFYHPAAKSKLERVRFLSGITLFIGKTEEKTDSEKKTGVRCACCGKEMVIKIRLPAGWDKGGRPPLSLSEVSAIFR